MLFPPAALERAMTIREVMLRAMSGAINWMQATKTPTLGIRGRAHSRLFSVYLNGSVFWVTRESAYIEGSEERDRVMARLRALGLFDPAVDLAEIRDGRLLSKRLADFHEGQFSGFLELIDAVAAAGNLVGQNA